MEEDRGTAHWVAPAKAAQRNVCFCVCVSGPMWLNEQQWTSLPHHRPIVASSAVKANAGPSLPSVSIY